MSDYFKPMTHKVGAAILVVLSLVAVDYSIPPVLKLAGLRFRFVATDYGVELGFDRTRISAADVRPVELLIFSMTYWTVWSLTIMSMILVMLLLLGKRQKWQPNFELVRVEKSLANGQTKGRAKRLRVDQIYGHLRNIHSIWFHSGLRR